MVNMNWTATKVIPAGHGTWRRLHLNFNHYPQPQELPPGLWHRYPTEGLIQAYPGESLSCWGCGPKISVPDQPENRKAKARQPAREGQRGALAGQSRKPTP